MFEDIKKEYKKVDKEIKFVKTYSVCAIAFIISSCIIIYAFNLPAYCILYFDTLFIMLMLLYLYMDYKKITKNSKLTKKNIVTKINIYRSINQDNHVKNLIKILNTFNCKSKSNLKLALDYYNSKQPLSVKTSLGEWIISAAVTLISIAQIAYDNNTGAINYDKLFTFLGSATGFVIFSIIILLIFKFFIKAVFISNNEINSKLASDISTIYINYDNYRSKLYK